MTRWFSPAVWGLAGLVLLAGCAVPREAARDLPNPESLDEVNDLLVGEIVTLLRVGGQRIDRVRQVSVGVDSVRYVTRRAETAALPTTDVAAITHVRGRGTRYGAAVGTIPGLLVMYSGIRGAQSPRAGERSASGSGLALAVPAILLGAAAGAWLGQLAAPGEVVVLYRGPVTRYRASD